jgi:regulator of nucleoside diphosphate kinase
VYHGEAGMFGSRLSVLTPLGVRLLGARVGDVIEWPVPSGVRRLRVQRILFQPRAAGDFNL